MSKKKWVRPDDYEPRSTYDVVTEKLVNALEAGTVPWRKPWAVRRIDGEPVFPSNAVTRRTYRGVNVFLLAMAQGAMGYSEPYWVTFQQARGQGGCVRKGEKGMPVVFWNWVEREDPSARDGVRRIPFLKRYTVFNVAQCDGLVDLVPPADIEEREHEPIEEAESLAAHYLGNGGPTVRHGYTRAYYAPSLDAVHVPKPEAFHSPEAYYATLFHELGHSTGHPSRLNRLDVTDVAQFGNHAYSKEELVAEMTAAFCCALAGCWPDDVADQNAAYLAGWIKVLKGDSKLAIVAAAQAQRAADMIQGRPVERAEPAPAAESEAAA